MTPGPAATSKRSRANTRTRLLQGAYQVFVQQGFHGASIGDVCTRAGFTRGAFYSNFASKEDLFLALWDEQATEIVTTVRRAVADIRQAPDAATASAEVIGRLRLYDRDWFVLNAEFLLHALRHPEAARQLAVHRATLRQQLWPAIRFVLDSGGLTLPEGMDPDTFTRLVIATFEGSQNQTFVEPEALGDGTLQGAVVRVVLAACVPVPTSAPPG